MIEIPESTTIARQLNETVRRRTILRVVANASPHKFAFYHGDPADYNKLLTKQVIGDSFGIGAMVEISVGERRIVLGDGANLRYYDEQNKAPSKHQLLIELDDGSALVCSVQMYGAVLVFMDGENDNKYYLVAKEKPQPLTDAFDSAYFDALRTGGTEKLSAKAFLATEQRIPGLGNGVLQDVLFDSGIHPKRKMGTLSEGEYNRLFRSVKETLVEMTRLGGRDTEKDLFGNPGGYRTLLSRNTVGKPCPVCGTEIKKAAYMGGAIYWCHGCQPLNE
ncbi:formamidopyrimidine-DNA glycosylase [Desulfosporosinus sp. OT]|uniref:formamidopyrimidine-DNA glycosylase n=1 Tax=Desulfosporosinus sp. OT TaxID=913865 RepID=UPI0002239CAC|nr:formamidopyrimidine-DNA glycosylase [Desulfosporosinus sp. OT]EGW40095.1 formamidopyrimidine-DNA glycosylase-like protein [Desulfosporosinus sp. OT]